MPSKYDKMRLPPEYDLRRKLTDSQKADIAMLFKTGNTKSALAKDYGVSPRLISFITDPKKHRANVALGKARLRPVIDRELNRVRMAKLRARKREIFGD